jgi:hypothetical protein
MKTRPLGFLNPERIPHDSEAFDYIRELHEYLWRFVRVYYPGASGDLSHWVDPVLSKVEAGRISSPTAAGGEE